MYQVDLAQIPQPLHEYVTQQWQRLEPAFSGVDMSVQQLSQLSRLVAGSDFAVEQLVRRPQMLAQLIDSGDLNTLYRPNHYAQSLNEMLRDVESEQELDVRLRRYRQREMVRLIWRDLNRSSDMTQTTLELSRLADACVAQALGVHYHWMTQRWGVPHSRPDVEGNTREQQMIVIAMGKLGANELNLSSDIDLMFCFAENGETKGTAKCLENQEFFIRLGKKLIKSLDALTAEGFVFRVDMRLRPFGSVSPLACSFQAMESYYQQHGREWERYAMIKARVIAGGGDQAQELMRQLRPFVYRKYIDYSAFESLREMKAMINSEVRRKGLDNNVKLGSGGIREIEFIVQAFQLIRGGRDSRLQQRSVMTILPLLPEIIGVPVEVAKALVQSYIFLRNTEHAIQALADQQTQELPSSPIGLLRVACSLGFENTECFIEHLQHHRAQVQQHFGEILAPVQESEADDEKLDRDWLLLWQGRFSDEEAVTFCTEKGFDEPANAWKLISDLAHSKGLSLAQAVTQERLKTVMPALLEQVSNAAENTQTLARVLSLVSAILRRSAYLVLLAENPHALQQLVKLCSASVWFAELLSKQPVLLDELISPQTLYSPPKRDELNAELRQQMLRVPEDDEEQQMDSLRYFKHAHLLRVAASDITGALPLMKVSDYLTWLAEAILQQVVDLAWHKLSAKHGVPCDSEGVESGRNFIVVAYGKLGGIELSYGSDLDLVFLHGANSNQFTNGERPIANSVFYTRLGQKVIHMLNTFTASGQLYEVDMRLRPAGNSGMLVSTLEAFEAYQTEEAWTWEHQALVRARVVVGSEALAEQFVDVRYRVLSQRRDGAQLLQQVSEMREKMRGHLGSSDTELAQQFNLKQDRGGIVDIEFLVQYLCLAHSCDTAALIKYTDNIRILDAIEEAGLLDVKDCEQLREAYKAFRSVGHRRAMQQQSTIISPDELVELRYKVSQLWQRKMPS
ncbi:MAG: bifunctional [glutamate--ammonia ligase]-adenylyl-L-tyrosine phosphorylase/[glutamate--ammonia-ligase] adenylyltransferase [Pseudomonadales bacterium]